MPHVTSQDGAKIAFEKTGDGPAVILVGGALSHRDFHGDRPLAAKLAADFTVYVYDRRGRGQSTDAPSYAVEREIEDLDALVSAAGGSARLCGTSSGAALALRTAARLGAAKVSMLALYEPPYGPEKQKQDFADQRRRVTDLIRTGPPGEAVAYFLSAIGMPPEALEGMKRSSDWDAMKRLEPTLAYDYAVLGDGVVPRDLARTVAVPVLVLDGQKSMDFMHGTADLLAAQLAHSERRTLPGQTHQVDPGALAPVLAAFFKQGQLLPPPAQPRPGREEMSSNPAGRADAP